VQVDEAATIDAATTGEHQALAPGAYATVQVSDTGAGMSAEVASRVFEPFFTTKAVGEGSGLGLSTVYGIVRQSGGIIRVDSTPGAGTTFTMYLPCVADEPCARGLAAAEIAASSGSETILLVEDESGVRAVAKRALERRGYMVLEGQNGRDALVVAAQYAGPIHLVLTDVVMPEIGGREFAEQLRSTRPSAAVLYMSGYRDDEVVRRGVLASETSFLQKPFTTAALLQAIRDSLDRP
jgi:two-component system, cell cycle sensor histidine kinase and response regulator CckA